MELARWQRRRRWIIGRELPHQRVEPEDQHAVEPLVGGDEKAILSVERHHVPERLCRGVLGAIAGDNGHRRLQPPVETTPDPSGTHDLELAVAALHPDRRAAFVLTQMLGLAYHDAAEILECPIGTVRSRVARAREDLIAAVDGDELSDFG